MPKKADYINRNKWNSQEIDLSWFIENYDTIVMSFNEIYENALNGGNPATNFGQRFNEGTGLNAKYKSYIYMINSNNTSGANIYVKDLLIKAMYVDQTEYLVDVNGLSDTTYDITKSFGEKGKAMLKMYEDETITYVLADARGNTLTSNIVDITKAENVRAWTIEAFVGEMVVYRGVIDFYNSTLPCIWDDDTTGVGTWSYYGQASGAMNSRGNGKDKTLTRDGKDVQMKYFDSTTYYKSKDSHLYFVVTPIHSKAYYQLFADKGVKLNFSIYVGVDSGVKGFNQLWVAGKDTTVSTDGYMSSKWFDLSIDLGKLLAKWSYVDFEDATYVWGARCNYGFIYLYSPQGYSETSSHGIYVGNFSVTQAQ